MVVLRSWLEEFIDISHYSDEQIVDALNSIGFEVEGVVRYTPPQNIVIGHICKREQHPDAQKLSVCEVDIGTGGHVQIVCGASNAKEGLLVAVATEGAVMPSGLTIAHTTLRGVDSYGMLCSAEELGYVKLNDGIWELDGSFGNLEIGQSLANLPKFSETLINIDVTPNRGDCLSILGVARELGAYFNLKIQKPTPASLDEHEPGIGRALNVHYSPKAKTLSMISIAKNHLQNFKTSALVNFRLALCELNSKNEYEKACLYVTHATGVLINVYPTRALALKDERMELFIAPLENGLDVIKSEKELAVIGLEQKEFADLHDDAVILHAFYTSPASVQDIKAPQTKSLYLAKRGTEPEISLGLYYLANMLRNIHGATFYSGVLEFGQPQEQSQIKMDVGFVEDIIGQELDKNLVVNLLTRLSFKVSTNIEFDNCLVSAPPFRHDIVNVYDLAEEVLRLKGLSSIIPKPLALINPKADVGALRDINFKRRLRHKSASAGFFETVHFIFTQKSLLARLGFATIKSELEITNPITAELDTLRTSLLPELLKSAQLNANNSKKRIALFESGVVFDESRNENLNMAYLYSGEIAKDSISNSGKPQMVNLPFFISRVTSAIGTFELINDEPVSELWHPYIFAKILIDKVQIGVLGKVNPLICDEFGLLDTFLCEIDANKLNDKINKAKEFSKFQPSIRDLTLAWSKDVPFSIAKDAVESLGIETIKSFYAIDWFSADAKSKTANLTVRIVLQSNAKTLNEEEISLVVSAVLAKLESVLGDKK